MLKSVFGALYKEIKNRNIVLESGKNWSSQLVKSLQIVVSNMENVTPFILIHPCTPHAPGREKRRWKKKRVTC